MSRLIECQACKVGDHDHHHRVVQAVPEGMLGGEVCPCGGECRNKTEGDMAHAPGLAPGLLDALARTHTDEPKKKARH